MIRACSYRTREFKNGKWVNSHLKHGFFHRWGERSEEYDNGVGSDTMAIIESDTGKIEMAYPDQVQFKDLKAKIVNHLNPLPHDYQLDN